MTTSIKDRARAFHALHRGGPILVLANVWDAASARVFELAGAPAVATTSSGLSATLGFPDGERVPCELVIGAVRRITATIDIPLSVDFERGYAETPAGVAANVQAVIDAGGIGINLEDGLAEPRVLVEKIAAIRALPAAREIGFFVNARTDAFLRGKGGLADQLADAIRRLQIYEAAGADGLFVPGAADPETIAAIVRAVRLPVNVMAFEGVPPAKELERLGVARVSVGAGPMRATLGLVRRIAGELLGAGTYEGFVRDTPSHVEVNGMFKR
jgi:2-methylisocitrate lyase-like PEP mutase family enzyme